MGLAVGGPARGEFEHAHDAGHRRAQFVTHGRQEGALGTAGGFGEVPGDRQRGGTLLHQVFEMIAMARKFELGLFPGSHIAEHDIQRRRTIGGRCGARRKLCPERLARGGRHPQFAGQRLAGVEDLPALQMKAFGIVAGDVTTQRLPDQRRPPYVEQGRGGQVGFEDQTLPADGAVADRRQVVELDIARPRFLERHLRVAQLLVLHFEFDLRHPQFVQRALRRFGEHGFGSCHAETGLAAQAFLRT
jgi:hypothetical protein